MGKFQWFRYYNNSINNHKVQALPGDRFKAWVNLLCVVSMEELPGGALPPLARIAWLLRADEVAVADNIAYLLDAELLDAIDDVIYPHDWDTYQYESDSSTERVRRSRAAKRGENVSGTPTAAQPLAVTEAFHETLQQRSGSVPGNVSVTPQIQRQNTETEREEKRAPTPKVPAPIVMSMRQDFEQFFTAYPEHRQGDKNAAWNAWQLVGSANELPSIGEILKGLEAYKTSDDYTGGYILGASKFIAQKRWVPPKDAPATKKLSRGPMPSPDLPALGKAVY